MGVRMLLTKDEVEEVTGFNLRQKQKRWCLDNGVTYVCRGDGSLAISREHIQYVLGVTHNLNRKNLIEPDFSSLH